ncbi:MAG: hypothetical protein M4579_007340, partial [Chaenotheca gracillima]
YGTLLGTQFFQSFVGGIVAFKSLPRPQFASLQQAIFPIYFSIQTVLPVVIALTYPGNKAAGIPSGVAGVLDRSNTFSTFVPLFTMLTTSLVNLAYFGPQTTKVMRERKHQETRDGKKSYDAPPHSKEMTRLNKSFGRLHGASTIVNLAGFAATMWYGVTLAERLQ